MYKTAYNYYNKTKTTGQLTTKRFRNINTISRLME